MCDHFAIFGEHISGFYARFQAVPARNLLKIPEGVSFETAAAASLVYVTAWHSLVAVGRLQAGEDILIIGAGGGVNTACIDIARLIGARKIFVVGSSDRKLEVALQLGADVAVNRHEKDWARTVFEATDRKGVAVVVDNVGTPTYQASIRSLKKGGRLLTVGNTSGAKFNFDNRYIFARHLSIHGSTMGPITDYNKVMELVFDGMLTPVIDSIYPLEDGLTALQKLQDGDVAGKLVLEIPT
jgi:NADPH:quinone reductase-like Zn-dependent oxidoreductase